MINYIILIAALAITCVSGYISVVGLTAIFSAPSAIYVIIAIASALEFGKGISYNLVTRTLGSH